MLVWPKNDMIRKILKHPASTAVPFREEGPADWPDDTFTYRRVQEGDLLLDDPAGNPNPPMAKPQGQAPALTAPTVEQAPIKTKK